jgi:hypothetical protein
MESFHPRQVLRNYIALLFLALFLLLFLWSWEIAFGYMVSILLKTLISIAFIGIACRKKNFNYERVGRFVVAIITLAATFSLGIFSMISGHYNLNYVVLWINIQIFISLVLLGGLLWKVGLGVEGSGFKIHGIHRLQIHEDAWLFFVSFAGLLMYSWWPIYFAINLGSSLIKDYSKLGLFYLIYSLLGPLVLKKALFEIRISDKRFKVIVQLLRAINIVMLIVILILGLGFRQGRVLSIGPVIVAGIFVIVNEGFSAVLFSTKIVGHLKRVKRYSWAIFLAVVCGTLVCELAHFSFSLYVAVITNLIGWLAYPRLKPSVEGEVAA